MNAIRSNSGRRFGILLLGGVALAGAMVVEAPPTRADPFGMLGGFFGFGGGGGYYRPRHYSYGPSRHHYYSAPSRGVARSYSAPPPPSAAESTSALAALAPPTTNEQTAVLKSIVPIRALGTVGASDDLAGLNKEDQEKNRD